MSHKPMLIKSTVKQHTRRTKTGRVVNIRQHVTSRTVSTKTKDAAAAASAQQLKDRKAINQLKEQRNRTKNLGKKQQIQATIDRIETEYDKKYQGRRPGVYHYDYGHYGSVYITTNTDLKGRGITKTTEREHGIGVYRVTDAAFEKIKKIHGVPTYAPGK